MLGIQGIIFSPIFFYCRQTPSMFVDESAEMKLTPNSTAGSSDKFLEE